MNKAGGNEGQDGIHDSVDRELERDIRFSQKVRALTAERNEDLTADETRHARLMEKLVSAYGLLGHIDLPVSLDEYFHESADKVDIDTRNGDQVISRFIARQRAMWEDPGGPALVPQTQAAPTNQTKPANGTAPSLANAPIPDRNQTPSELEAGLGAAEKPSPNEAQEAFSFRQRILTVSMFWIWKLNGMVCLLNSSTFRDKNYFTCTYYDAKGIPW